MLSGARLSEKAGASELTKCLGSPTREKTYPSGEASLFHEAQGLVLWTAGGELRGVGLNFNWDGDKKFPETSFTGGLMIGDLKVDRNTTFAQLQSLKGNGITCMDDSMCAGGTASDKVVVGFEKNLITQISFLFSKK